MKNIKRMSSKRMPKIFKIWIQRKTTLRKPQRR